MEHVQESITTLHDLADPPAVDGLERTIAETAVVVPMTEREEASLAAEGVLRTLEKLQPGAVYVPVRAPPERIEGIRSWLDGFDLPLTVLWCSAPAVTDLLAETGLDNGFGKGRDVWLALGPAADAAEYVAVHDADATSYGPHVLRRLLAPLALEFSVSKGYYARVEGDRLYGRLQRLFYEPLVRALVTAHPGEPILEYLGAFRYALAGEFATTATVATELRPPPAWGLEVATLGDAFDHAGPEATAQVDLGRHEHDHRAVAGDTGLEGMSTQVGHALFRVLETHGVTPDYGTLADRYRAEGERLVAQYRADAAFNGLTYDAADERGQVRTYAEAISAPGPDRRLPAWSETALTPEAVCTAAAPNGEP